MIEMQLPWPTLRAFILGVLAALLWQYARLQVFGVLAASRFLEHVPSWVYSASPEVIFLGAIVLPTYYIFVRFSRPNVRTAIASSVIAFAALQLYSLRSVPTSDSVVLSSAISLLVLVVISFGALRLARPRQTQQG